MKTHQRLIPALILGSISFPSFAETLLSSQQEVDDYLSITAFVGSRLEADSDDGTGNKESNSSAQFAQAIALNWAYELNSEGELLFSNSRRTSGNVDAYIQYLHFGGRILFKDETPFSTSIALGIGGTYLNPEDNKYDAELAFSASIAGGIRYQLSEKFALRSDLRFYGTLFREGHNESFCGGENCDDGYLIEAELLAGLEYRF